MIRRVLHLLSQRPGWTGSGVALDAIMRAASDAGWRQAAVVGTPAAEPNPAVGGLSDDQISPLVFECGELDFPLPGMSDVMPYTSSRFADLSGGQLERYCAAWKRLVAATVEKFQPGLIHSNHLWLLSSIVRDVAPDIPVVAHCHGTGLRQLELCPSAAGRVRRGCARCDAFVVLNRAQAEIVRREFGAAVEQVHVVGSGFNDSVFHHSGRTSAAADIVYAGKLSRAKGLPWLIDAVERLRRQRPELVLHIAGAGAGPEADAIRDRVSRTPGVVLHGQLGQPELADLLRRSAVFALPSFFEGLPLVLVEAAACGCKLVSTALPGVVDQLAPVLGDNLELVAPPRRQQVDQPLPADLPQFVDDLTLALESALDAPAPADPSETVASMTWPAVFRRIETVWRRLLESNKA